MIIYGTRTRILPGQSTQSIPCATCGRNEFTSFGLVRYFHLFWVPVFPTSRKIGLECAHCKHTSVDGDLPGTIGDDLKSSIFTRGRMFPLFSGLVLLALLAGFVYFSIEQDNARQLQYVTEPRVDDVYIVDFSDLFDEIDPAYKYGIMQVVSFDDSEVGVNISNYTYTKPGISDANLSRDMAKDDFFAAEIYSITRQNLVDLLEKSSIRDVRRAD